MAVLTPRLRLRLWGWIMPVVMIVCIMLLPCPPGYAGDIASAYQILKSEPGNQEFLNRLLAAGVNESQIESFVDALSQRVSQLGPVSDANFNDIMFDALVLELKRDSSMRKAVFDAFAQEISEFEASGQIPSSLLPLRNAVRDSLLSTSSTNNNSGAGTNTGSTGGGGGGGAATGKESAVARSISDQLSRPGTRVVLEIPAAENEIIIPGDVLERVNQAGRQLEITTGAVSITIPSQAVALSSGLNLMVSIKVLSEAEGKERMAAATPAHRLAGDIYYLAMGTESTVAGLKPEKALTVVLPYKEAQVPAEDQEKVDAYRYDKTSRRWFATSGKVDRQARKVSFQTMYSGEYAAMVYDAGKLAQGQAGTEGTGRGTGDFKDLEGHWAAETVRQMVAKGLIFGVTPNSFAPDRRVTRAEFTTLLVRALGLEPDPLVRSRFSDVPAGLWYHEAVNAAAAVGLVSGLTANTFAPDTPLTREQMAVMVVRAINYQGRNVPADEQKLAIFKDRNSISSWARSGVAMAVAGGLISGHPDGTFTPKAGATRAQAAVMIWSLVK